VGTAGPVIKRGELRILITGGAGFIGFNYAWHRLLKRDEVHIIDDMSRKGSGERALALRRLGHDLHIHEHKLEDSLVWNGMRFDAVIHLAGQTAVTRSILDPWDDFNANLKATIKLLESIRRQGKPYPTLIFASTNKVYGPQPNMASNVDGVPYPVDEFCPTNLRTPYGIYKGAADFYMQDYGRQYGIPTVILRQSCVYGPWQTAESDQGWVMHFLRSILNHDQITIFGDGNQVRDLLYIADLAVLYDLLLDIPQEPGAVFNVGGGDRFKTTLLQAIDQMVKIAERFPKVCHAPARPDDQTHFVSDNTKITKHTGWEPTVAPPDGISRLVEWCRDDQQLFQGVHR